MRVVAPDDRAEGGHDRVPSASGAPDPGEAPETEWWRDPRLPWTGRPSRSDVLCWAGLSVSGLVSFALLPLRPALLAANPLALAALTGSRTAVVALGALAAVGRTDWWWVGLVLATISVVKFDPLVWWAGRLWGRGVLDLVAGRSPRAARNVDRAERLALRWRAPAIALTYVVPVLPTGVVYATAGASGMTLRAFLAVDVAAAFATRCLYLYLGYRIGQPAVDVLDAIADWSLWLSLALLAVVLVGSVRAARAATQDP